MHSKGYVLWVSDEYEQMTIKDIPSNWPDHLDTAIKHLNDHILTAKKSDHNFYSPGGHETMSNISKLMAVYYSSQIQYNIVIGYHTY